MEQKKIALAVVGNYNYLVKNLHSFMSNLKFNGKFEGDVIILTSFFTPTFLIPTIWKFKNIKILRFKRIKFLKEIKKRYLNLDTKGQPNRFKTKNFQWFKLNLFNKKLKSWDYILYLDINLTIHDDINPIFNIEPEGIMLKADSYPNYNTKLISQFDTSQNEINLLNSRFNLDDNRYFQTGLMFFNTDIIYDSMVNDILDLANLYPISITNEQGILNLYLQKFDIIAKELPEYINDKIIYYYWMIKGKKIIITKQLVEQYK